MDSVIIVVDGAKGVETQTRKLMEVCRMRNTPVIIFINKMDREAKDPFDLLDELEEELSIHVRPLTWPIESGPRFKGVYNIYERNLNLYQPSKQVVTEKVEVDINTEKLDNQIGLALADKLRGELELIDGVYPEFQVEEYLKGELAPGFGLRPEQLRCAGVAGLLCGHCLQPLSREGGRTRSRTGRA